MVRAARAAGRSYKLVSQIERVNGGVVASVWPEQLAPDDALAAAIPAPSLLAHFAMDMVPELTVTLPVPMESTVGPDVTAYDVLADFIRAARG
jgi:homoserine dehydrogenase